MVVRVKPVRVARHVKVNNVACVSRNTGGRVCKRAAFKILPARARGGGVTG
jgi:hypothetical protein